VADEVIAAVRALQGTIIPDSIDVRVTRNYGETADHKVNELITHLLIAIVTVLALIFSPWAGAKR
jgi:multidrug efflux pump subunit AcrB